MAVRSSGSLVSFAPLNREQRVRRQRLSAVLVIVSIAGSVLLLQVFHDSRRAPNAPAPAAFAYFPN
jgi:hypothetical protein